MRAILRQVKDISTHLDVFSPNRLKRRPLEMPKHNLHHTPVTIATAPFRAGARCTIWRLRRQRCGDSRATPERSDPRRGDREPSTTLSNME
jgi:hypothetical protein